jgi:hypothetical protein
MANIDPTTPQLEAVKKFIDAYISLNINNVGPHISKNFTFQTFPKIDDMPDETKGTHFERYGSVLSLFTKVEVRIIQRRRTARPLADIHCP